jgi:hypothetical protein
MSAVDAPAAAGGPALAGVSGPARRGRLRATAWLLRLELRHNAMLWMIPVVAGLFWFTTYRKVMTISPLWYPRAATLQPNLLLIFACPVTGAAAWMGSREARRRTVDVVHITARSRCVRQLITWGATSGWAILAYLGCVGVVYGLTARQAIGGGPLWWPIAVGAATLAALSALGFAAGTLAPSRFTGPLTSIAAFFALALSTELIHGSQSYWVVSPVVAAPWDLGPVPGVAIFYHYLPDLPIAQVMFLAGLTAAVLGALALPADSGRRPLRAAAAVVTAVGLLAAVTAVRLAGTGELNSHGMIAIAALHDAANDRPIPFTPACSHTAIPVCLNPAYASYLPSVAAALEPALNEIAGLPGAPARISQVGATYQQGTGNGVAVRQSGPTVSGTPPTYHMLLPDQLNGPPLTASQLTEITRETVGPSLIIQVTGYGPGASPAQRAVTEALLTDGDLRPQILALPPGEGPLPTGLGGSPGQAQVRTRNPGPPPWLRPGSPVVAAARRFAALPVSARRTWLLRHLPALRAGQIPLDQLP